MTGFGLREIGFRSGAVPGEEAGPIQVDNVVVFVGPNNSGKSQALRDLYQWAVYDPGASRLPMPASWPGGTVVSRACSRSVGSLEELRSLLEHRRVTESPTGFHLKNFDLRTGQAKDAYISTQRGLGRAVQDMTALYTVLLDGRSRFDLAAGRDSGAGDQPPSNHWMAIERDRDLYLAVDKMIHDAVRKHLVVQTFTPGRLEPALADDPVPEWAWQSTQSEAISLQRKAAPLSRFSDGVQVYCGLIAAVAALPQALILIDEPEVFLHPTLVRRLGRSLSRITRDYKGSLVAATHSADFLMGCIDESPTTTVVRLDYRESVSATHLLEGGEVARMSRVPILRSADSLKALFSESAVVCEGDSDRAFYEEINRRLLDEEGRYGAPDTVFLNAQNWQTTVELAAPLRNAGVPAAVVLDLDALVNDEKWPEFWRMMGLSPGDRDRLSTLREAARDAVRASGRVAGDGSPWKAKVNGLSGLEKAHEIAVEEALEELASVGVFLVPQGEVENWLQQFGKTNKKTWLRDVFEALGVAGEGAYVRPGPDDVWAFVERIARWVGDPRRAGMPA